MSIRSSLPLPPETRLGPYTVVSPRRRWDGRGVPGDGREARPRGRDQAAAGRDGGEPGTPRAFGREAKALAALDHPGIVTVYSVEEHEGVPFLTMQLVEGEPLDRQIPPGGMPVERILEIATALADALAAAHDRGIVHRDLKPANVMLTKDERVKILDFGLAKMIEGQADSSS